MADWKVRGYVQDSDDEDDSQHSLPPTFTVSAEAIHIGGIAAVEPGELHDGRTYDQQNAREYSHRGGYKGITITNAGKNRSTAATPLVPREKEDAVSPTMVQDGHKTTNVVVDADDDIDELQQDHYNSTPTAPLEATLLDRTNDLKARARSNALTPNEPPSSSSSSLSTLSELSGNSHGTPYTTGSLSPTHGDQAEDQEPTLGYTSKALESKSHRNTTNDPGSLISNQVYETRKGNRSLRHRNPIQLHPYALESEQYRQTLKARGVRPLRIAQMEAEAAKSREQDSQNVEFNGEGIQIGDSDIEHTEPNSSSPINPQRSPVAASQDLGDVFIFGEDDLPDMSTLLGRSKLKYVGNGQKRRKIAKENPQIFRVPRGLDSNQSPSLPQHEASRVLNEEQDIFDEFPSPPRSVSRSPRETRRPVLPVFRVPRRTSPAVLPTPITSSEPRRSHVLDIFEDDQSDDHSYQIREVVDAADLTDAELSPSEEETSHHLQHAQRKIRGVLPASWLKLDLKTQKKKPNNTCNGFPNMSPDRNPAQRGVARTVVAPASRSLNTSNEIMVLSDEESAESETDELRQEAKIHQDQHRMLEDEAGAELLTGRRGEAPEDDRIDAMLPKATRTFRSRKSRKRQLRMGDFHTRSRNTAHEFSDEASNSSAHQCKTMEKIGEGHQRKPRFRPPRLGILDAPLTNGSSSVPVPQFLKVASRTARSRYDRGRHSPSRKFVRLATKNDDNDANEILRHWREGTIVPFSGDKIHKTPSRQPLYARSVNSPMPFSTPEKTRISNEFKSSASRMTSAKSQIRPIKSRTLQTSLDHLIERRHKGVQDSTQRKVPSWLQQAIEKSKKRGQIASSLREVKDSRPAMLESTREDADRTNAQAIFHRDLARVNHFDNDSGLPGVVVRRYFGDDSIRPPNAAAPQADLVPVNQHGMGNSTTFRKAYSHKRRKRKPHRMDVPQSWSREPSAIVSLEDYRDQGANSSGEHRKNLLIGLGPFGTRYSDTFDVTPLPTGTCFSTNTLLGSGTFAKSLKFAFTANLESLRGYTLVKFKDKSLRWGPWNDAVSSELGEVFEAVSQTVQNAVGQNLEAPIIQTDKQVLASLNSILEYFSNHLSFLDPVDRVACVQRCNPLLSALVVELIDRHAVRKTSHQARDNLQEDIQISTLVTSIANQLHQISKHELIPSRLHEEVRSLVQKAADHTLDLSLTNGLEPFETCLSKLRNQKADYRIQHHSIEAFVVVQHVLGQDHHSKTNVWLTLLKAIPTKSSDGFFDIRLAEQSWKLLFFLLPFLELDAQGVVEIGRRFKIPFDDWTLVKRLVNPVLEASLSNQQGQPASFNPYCRAVFGRCLHLTNGWGWRRCDSIIGMLFDYFARNDLGHLRSEESKGSPVFLERLEENPPLVFEPEDRGFHILLKIIGSGVRHMQQSCPEKKIRDLVWRLMPNHGRSHPKEEAIRQEHLDALRNHHDLLCTLYWASPPSCRPRLTVIRNLVNLETSHREACHINIRAWFNLVKFQLSTNEPISNLEPFADWHNHILEQILRQHSLARTEAEDQVRSAQSIGGLTVSKDLLETTIARNQRQVEAVLRDALICLKLAVDAAQNSKAASTLVSVTLVRVFELFDASRTQVNKPIIEALDVLSACASKSAGSRDENEDSQDYGDWSAFVDDASATPPQEDTAPLFATFQDHVRHLLSNCFGADLVPGDNLLLKVVDVWVTMAQVLVRNGRKSWADYLGRFGNDSWSSLRDTEQTRKFSAYYMATLIERDDKIYQENETLFLTSWVCSMVERESLLKFQQRLTSALLNTRSENALLHNLPFSIDAAIGSHQISASQFADRRLSLISSLLSNMRVSVESAVVEISVNGNRLRQEVKDLLKHLMATMKRNYQELGHGSNARGSYVDFVHRIIELLQQHTSTFCPIDRFFTDNSAFPLPASDPTYVVGQLKNYGLRLRDARTPKQLAVFVQSVSERAAVDGQQTYLTNQLHTAMSNTFEEGVSESPTLRSFIVKNIVPAYVEMAFSTTCGWVLAMPYLQALEEVFKELLKDLDGVTPDSVIAIASTLTIFLESVKRPLESLVGSSGKTKSRDASTLKTLSACYSAIAALLPVLDYLVRMSGPTLSAVENIQFFKSFALYFSAVLRGECDVSLPYILTERPCAEELDSDILRFATQELRDSLSRSWTCHNDQYYLIRGSTRKEFVVDVGLHEEEKAHLLTAFEDFSKMCAMMPALKEEDDGVPILRERNPLEAEYLVF